MESQQLANTVSDSKHLEMMEDKVKSHAEHEDVELNPSRPLNKSKAEKRVVLKQDLSIVLLLAGCFFFAYLVSADHYSPHSVT